MPASRTAHRAGRIVTGLGALVVLVGLLAGAPVALLALAGNPLPDHAPTIGEIGTTLTSRDDGQLFLRALAVVGWLGWATFALSVLVELPARILRRPAIRLPGLGRQQRFAAALVGAVALVLAASPAATAASAAVAAPVAAAPVGPGLADGGPALVGGAPGGDAPRIASGPAPAWLAGATGAPLTEPEPVYRVEKGDYLGHIAGRYLGDFNRYPELARLNKIRDPDRIRPGQLLHLPPTAEDRGFREHATGLVAVPPPDGGAGHPPAATERTQPRPDTAGSQPGTGDVRPEPPRQPPAVTEPLRPADAGEDRGRYVLGGASQVGQVGEINRPLAVSAVIALAGIVGAQVGAVLGLRNRSGRRPDPTTGRHRVID